MEVAVDAVCVGSMGNGLHGLVFFSVKCGHSTGA